MSGKRKTKPLRSGYAKLLAILLSIAIIPGLLISALAYYVSIDNAKKQAVTYSTQYLDLIVDSNAAILQQSKSIIFEMMLNFTTYSDILRQPKPTAESLQLLQTLEKKKLAGAQYVKSFYFIDNRSGKVYTSDRSAIYALADFPDQNLVQLVRQPERLLFNDLFERHTSSGENVASYVAGYPLTGDKLGYLVVDLDLERFASPAKEAGRGGHLLILNRHEQLVNSEQREWLNKMEEHPGDYVVIRKASAETGLSYQYVIPKHLLTANNRILLDSIVGICLVFILFEAAAAWFSSNKLYTPLRNLLFYIQQLVGDRNQRPEGEDEYYYVRSVITNMNVQNKDYLDAIQANSSLFKQRQLTRLLNGEASASRAMHVPDHLRLKLPHSHFLVMMMEIEDLADFRARFTVLEQELMLYAVTNITEEVLSVYGTAAAAPVDTHWIAVLLNHDRADGEQPAFEDMAFQIQTKVGEYLKMTLSIGIGQSFALEENIPQSHEQARRALLAKVYFGRGSITSHAKLQELEQPSAERPIVSWGELRSQLKTQLQSADWEPVSELLADWVDTLSFPGMTEIDLQLYFLQYTAILSDACTEFSIDFEELLGKDRPVGELVRQTASVADLSREMTALAKLLHERIKSTKDHIHQELIQHLLLYIREHLDQDLTLESLAEKVYMHPAYLSRVCKSLTGKGLGEQIVLARIERAKELLRVTGQSVNDISVQLGYTNPRAFYRLFKEYTSMTPGEFRKNAGLRNVK